MSTRVMDACWGLKLAPTEKAVLMSLADQCNDAGVCWPSVASLMERTCLGERTVRRAVRALEEAGYLATDMQAMKNNRYRLDLGLLRRLAREREDAAEAAASAAQRGATVAPLADDEGGHTGRLVVTKGATQAGEGGHCGPRTVIEPNTNTPHTPLPSAGGLADPSVDGPGQAPRGQGEKPMLGMAAWLEQVKAAGQDAIPADDAVWGYAERVGLGRELVALAWREFKRRQLASRKRQKDWRRAFRNCVEGNWYGLWWMQAGEPAQLASKGEQVRRFFGAEDAAGAVVTGSAAAGEGGEA